MTWLECLNSFPPAEEDISAEQRAAWRETLGNTLPQLTRLTKLLLTVDERFDFAAVSQLPRLQRLALWTDDAGLPDPAALAGPWLASLRWLGLEWAWLEPAVSALRAAPRLEYVCSLTMPACADEGRWRAAWDFLATHPPLRCFGIDATSPPAMPVFDAVIGLKNRRPALPVRRIARSKAASFEVEVLDEDRIPAVLH